MKRILLIGIIVIILVLAGLGIGLTTREKNNEKVMQKTEVVKRGDLAIKISPSGNLESLLSVDVKSNVEGEIDKLYIKEGDLVEKGKTLLQIDDEQIREEMKQAEANVSAVQAQLEQAKRSLGVKEKQLDSELQQQRDSVSQAQINYNATKATTLQQLSQQETDIQTAKEALEQDKTTLRQAEISLTQADLTLSELQQSEAAAKVDLDNAESQLKRTEELYEKKYVPKNSLEDAQASYANSHSRYDSTQKRVLSQQETIKSHKENIEMRQRAILMRETTIKFEEQNLELLKQTRAAQEKQAQTQLNIAQTRLKQLEDNINDEKDISRFSLESAKANLLRAQSTLNNQMERLGWTTIVAPMSGIVINLEIEEGEIVTSGRSAFSQSPALMQIVDLSQMVVKTSINEVDMEKLKLGQSAEIRVRAYPDRVYRGEVREISPSGQPRDNVIYFEVMIAVLDSPKELRPGMTADVDIIVLERKDTLILPIETVRSEEATIALLTVPEADADKLKTGQSVELESGRGPRLTGTVSKLTDDNKGGNVEVTLAGGRRGVRSGKTSVNLIVDGNTISDIPAMVRSTKGNYVMMAPKKKAGGNGSAVEGIKTNVEVGEQNDMFIEILSGLEAGDEVFVQTDQQQSAESNRRGDWRR